MANYNVTGNMDAASGATLGTVDDEVAQQQQNLSNFNANLGTYQQDVNNVAQQSGDQAYAQGKAQVDSQANARGLLYGGLHQGAMAGVANNAAATQQNTAYQGTQNLYNLQNQYTNDAINNGLLNYQGVVSQGLNNTAASNAQANQSNSMFGSLFSGAATVGAIGLMSDKKTKKDIKDEDPKKLDVFIEKIKPKSFKYKDEAAHGEGDQHGVIAQDLEKSDVGKTLVKETPEGKKVDVGRALAAMLALQSRMNERVKKVEGKN